MLIEIARNKGGVIPDVSFGTHFFQDLVEADIHCLPLYPDSDGIKYKEDFFKNTNNKLEQFLPEYKDYSNNIRVINLYEVCKCKLDIIMDGEREKAIGYLNNGKID
jgi:hypothetical protein